MDPLLRERDLDHFLRCVERIRPSTTRGEQSGMSQHVSIWPQRSNRSSLEPYDGIARTFRLRRELEMVHADIYRPLPQQSRSFPTKAEEITFG